MQLTEDTKRALALYHQYYQPDLEKRMIRTTAANLYGCEEIRKDLLVFEKIENAMKYCEENWPPATEEQKKEIEERCKITYKSIDERFPFKENIPEAEWKTVDTLTGKQRILIENLINAECGLTQAIIHSTSDSCEFLEEITRLREELGL